MSLVDLPGPATAEALAEPHHDGSELYVLERPEDLGGSAVLRVRAPHGAAEQVLIRYVHDGEPRTAEAVVDAEGDGETWWRAEIPVWNPIVRYRWLLAGGRLGYRWLNGRGLYPQEVHGGDDFVLSLEADGPPWHLSAAVYEIFPDRFASSGARHDPPEWAVPRAWDDLPEGRSRYTSREWFGGDLPGIEQHLDHLELLGVNAIYLTPFFPAGSTHRYDASTFDRVDPLLGGDEAFALLARAAHGRGFRLIGDLTLNHCGVGHDWFVRARQDASSPERSFFWFDPSERHGYASWLGVKSLPTLDWRSAELRERMGSVLRFWLDAGLDGWRIDVANMVGRHRELDLNHDVARWTRSTVGSALLVAEHGHDFRLDIDGRGWQGVMNYAGFLRPTWWWLRHDGIEQDVFTEAPAPRYGGGDMVAAMRAFRSGIPWETVLHSWTLLDSHDTARFRSVTPSREAQLVGVGLMATSPGVPMIFAGDEVGLEGDWGEDARRTIPWSDRDRWDTELLARYCELTRLRRSSDALARGGIRYVHVSEHAVAYLRETPREQLLCLAARSAHAPIVVPFTQLETVYGEDARDGVLPADGPAFHIWRIHG